MQVLHLDNVNCPTRSHIARCASHLPIPYKIMPFFRINYTNPALRDNKEFYFIKKTKAKLNNIINTSLSWSIQINITGGGVGLRLLRVVTPRFRHSLEGGVQILSIFWYSAYCRMGCEMFLLCIKTVHIYSDSNTQYMTILLTLEIWDLAITFQIYLPGH